MSKDVSMINNKIGDLVTRFSISGKMKLIGSNAKRGLLFTNDYDLVVVLKDRAETLAKHFKDVMLEIPKKDYFFMDLKAGLDKRLVYDFDNDNLEEYLKNKLITKKYKLNIRKSKGEERVKLIRDLFILRWKPQDIINGYIKLVDGSHYSLVDALKDDTIIKLDVIIPVGDRLAEVSENYIYHQSKPDDKQIIKDLANDIEKYKYNNTMKSLKRLYSIMKLDNPNDKRLDKLELFFNSQYGLVNKVANDMALLLDLREKHSVPFSLMYNNIQMLKEQLSLSNLVSKKKILELDKINEKNYDLINKYILYLRGIINPRAKELLAKFT